MHPRWRTSNSFEECARQTPLSCQLLTRRTVASVDLIEALGGGWNYSDLPSANQILAKPP